MSRANPKFLSAFEKPLDLLARVKYISVGTERTRREKVRLEEEEEDDDDISLVINVCVDSGKCVCYFVKRDRREMSD